MININGSVIKAHTIKLSDKVLERKDQIWSNFYHLIINCIFFSKYTWKKTTWTNQRVDIWGPIVYSSPHGIPTSAPLSCAHTVPGT